MFLCWRGVGGDQGEIKSSAHKKLPATYLLFSSTLALVGDVLVPVGGRRNFKR